MALTIGVPMGSPTRLWASLLLFPRYASMASDLAEVYSPTKRESACRSYIAHWAAQGSVDMGLACRRVYTEVACTAAVTALGGSWPDASEASSNAEAVAAAACQAVERQLYNRRGLMLNQQAAKRHEGSGPAGRRSLSLLAAGAAARQGIRTSYIQEHSQRATNLGRRRACDVGGSRGHREPLPFAVQPLVMGWTTPHNVVDGHSY